MNNISIGCFAVCDPCPFSLLVHERSESPSVVSHTLASQLPAVVPLCPLVDPPQSSAAE